MKFDELFYNDDMLDALWDMRFDECSPVQEMAIPPVLEGRDLLACAQTGTGKTAAYLLPLINMIAEGNYPKDAINAIIMVPTRELAQQIDQQLQGFSYYLPVNGMAIYGGTDGHTYEQQRKSLRLGADIVIATPGRLLSHLSMGYVDLSDVSFFVLDEADRMLDMGFFEDIIKIVSHMPKERQTLLFSATMPPRIRQMADAVLNDPVEVKLAVSKPAEKIRQTAYVVYESQKLPLIRHIFAERPPRRAILFASSKLKVKELARTLRSSRYTVGEMHSDLDQSFREDVILKFKAGKINLLVATDIVARGIDVDDIELVVNYDVPHEAEDYVHRIGRTARADRDGEAITFVGEKEFGKFRMIEKLLEKEVEKAEVPAELGSVPDYRGRGSNAGRSSRTRTRAAGDERHGRKGRSAGKPQFRNKKTTASAKSPTPSGDKPKPQSAPVSAEEGKKTYSDSHGRRRGHGGRRQ